MNEMTRPCQAAAGDAIEHDLMPGFIMDVRAAEPCETDGARHEPHSRFQVTDPDGNEDWLCAYDVHKVSA